MKIKILTFLGWVVALSIVALFIWVSELVSQKCEYSGTHYGWVLPAACFGIWFFGISKLRRR